MSHRVTASCHCGAIRLSAELSAPLESAARCNCSFCRRRQAANVSARWDSVEIKAGADLLRPYRFGTRKALHFFCPVCGIYTHHRRFSNPDECGINLYCIEGQTPDRYEPLPWSDGP